MSHFTILEELFSSDMILFLIAAAAAAAFASVRTKDRRKDLLGIFICAAVYAASEFCCGLNTSYLIEMLLLFAGTTALGGVIGFAAGLLVFSVGRTLQGRIQ